MDLKLKGRKEERRKKRNHQHMNSRLSSLSTSTILCPRNGSVKLWWRHQQEEMKEMFFIHWDTEVEVTRWNAIFVQRWRKNDERNRKISHCRRFHLRTFIRLHVLCARLPRDWCWKHPFQFFKIKTEPSSAKTHSPLSRWRNHFMLKWGFVLGLASDFIFFFERKENFLIVVFHNFRFNDDSIISVTKEA